MLKYNKQQTIFYLVRIGIHVMEMTSLSRWPMQLVSSKTMQIDNGQAAMTFIPLPKPGLEGLGIDIIHLLIVQSK